MYFHIYIHTYIQIPLLSPTFITINIQFSFLITYPYVIILPLSVVPLFIIIQYHFKLPDIFSASTRPQESGSVKGSAGERTTPDTRP